MSNKYNIVRVGNVEPDPTKYNKPTELKLNTAIQTLLKKNVIVVHSKEINASVKVKFWLITKMPGYIMMVVLIFYKHFYTHIIIILM